MPEYFSQKVNLNIALAPVASTSHVEGEVMEIASQHIEEITLALVDVLGIYTIGKPIPLGIEGLFAACNLPYLKEVCMEIFHKEWGDRESVESIEIAGSNTFLAGAGYQTYIYYGQMIRDKQWFRLYDHGKRTNKAIYGQSEPPMVPLDQFAVPTGLFSGDLDPLANPTDVAWLSEQIHDWVVFEN